VVLIQDAYVLSGARTDFNSNWKKNKDNRTKGIADVYEGISYVVNEAVNNASNASNGFRNRDIKAAFIGNLDSAAFANQGHLASVLSTELSKVLPDYESMEIYRTENACASSGAALNLATRLIKSGEINIALVVGAEQMRTGADVGHILAKGVDKRIDHFSHAAQAFAELARRYMETYGIDEDALFKAGGYAVENDFRNARTNPNAQMRLNDLGYDFFKCVVEGDKTTNDYFRKNGNPRMSSLFNGDERYEPLKRYDCSQVTDGAVALILASGDYMASLGLAEGISIAGSSLQVDKLSLTGKLTDGKLPSKFNGLNNAVNFAFNKAGLEFPEDVKKMDYIETHDCFAITQLVLLEQLGFAKSGQSVKLGKDFWDEFGPRINPSGGLMADGHPIGATGARMMYELASRLKEEDSMGMMVNVGDVFASNYVAVLKKANITKKNRSRHHGHSCVMQEPDF